MTTPSPLSRSLKQISIGLAALIIAISAVALTAISLQRHELDQFRQEVGKSVDAVSTLSLRLADAQSALMLAASTYDPWWPGIAGAAMAQLQTSMEELDEVAAVTGNPAATDRARTDLRKWLGAAEEVLYGGATAKSVATEEYPAARSALIAVTDELLETRNARRSRHDALIIGGAIAIVAATAAALVLVAVMSRHYVRRLTTPLNQLKEMVDARVAGDTAIRARTDQGFSEAVHLAEAINELSDSNNALRAAQESTIQNHLLAERVAAHLTPSDEPHAWRAALDTLRNGLGADSVALLFSGAPGEPACVGPDDDATWVREASPGHRVAGHSGDVVAVALELGGQPMGTLLARRVGGRWTASDAEALELCSGHLAAWLALQSVIETTRQLDADKTRFLATTSHELRTPLTAVVAWLSMFHEGDLGELTADQQHAMGVVERNISRLRDLIEDLLTVNQLDSGQAKAVRTRMDVAALTCRVAESLEPMAARAGVQLSCHVEPGSADTQGDPGQIERAITNIAQNAVKFTAPGGLVELRVAYHGAHVLLTCTDTGIGIPSDDLPHVRERFRRADNAHGLPGTGLGLSIVESIMEAHDGTFELESAHGVGTTVILTLPSCVDTVPAQ